MYKRNKPNDFQNVQYSRIRIVCDKWYVALMEAASASYYNTVKYGIPTNVIVLHPDTDEVVHDFGIQLDTEEKFRRVEFILTKLHMIVVYLINQQIPAPYSDDEIRYIRDENGEITRDRLQDAKDRIKNFYNNNPAWQPILLAIKNWLDSRLGINITWQ